ncbi:indolepyruvate ferredoxin oxidoreductase subunit alpha [Rhodovulum steppense]|uniref:4Fe-4S binding protein n=1 Tax=Rhodovulum steppense TaxID=540251 RepID=A0A4R1Z0M6_9RHOB|nr:4Fe-4S binding protein [Rhodovulum steppense]TCM87125.1 4Fe-4S binding protein [Rhodovulum steppense]
MTAIRASDAPGRVPAGRVRLDRAACLSAQRPGAPCTACATSCPGAAIRIAGRDLRVAEAACSGCGLCAPSCPTGAITVAGFAPAALFDCARVRKPAAGAVRLPCLGGLTPETLRAALAHGDVGLIDRSWCAACALGRGNAAPWAGAVAIVNAEMQALDLPQRVRVRPEPTHVWRARPAPAPAADAPARRGLFDRLARAATADQPRDPLAALPGTARTPGPDARAAQLAALAGDRPLPRALFPALEFTGQHSDLDALARLCPTRALACTETDNARALIFDAIACIGCGACTGSGALRAIPAPEGTHKGPETLATEPRATCPRCRMRFTPRPGQTACAACARDTDLAALAHGLMRPGSAQTDQE